MPTNDDDDDAVFSQIAGLGAATTAARDESLDPELRDMAAYVQETAADKLRGDT
jgi:hypothetical protein